MNEGMIGMISTDGGSRPPGQHTICTGVPRHWLLATSQRFESVNRNLIGMIEWLEWAQPTADLAHQHMQYQHNSTKTMI